MLGELSPRQSELALWWHRRPDLDGVVADGSIRSGKTVSMDAGFLLWSQANFSGQKFIVAGQSVAAANRNVIGPMKRIMSEDLGWSFSHNRGDNVLTVGSNEYHIFGAPNERSQDAIQGMTAAGCLLDEAALLPRSFIEQAVGRCSVDGAKIWLDCNPGSPSNYVKTDLIDMADEKRLLHLHFTLDDNPHLPESTKERYRRMFTGVFHDRYIRGLWVLAEGLVYQTPAEAYTCTDAEADELPDNPWAEQPRWFVSIDYGIVHPFAALLWKLWRDRAYVVDEYYYDGSRRPRRTDEEHYEALVGLIGDRRVEEVVIDPSATSMREVISRHNRFDCVPADNDVTAGISTTSSMLANGAVKVAARCRDTLREFGLYSWDSKAPGDRVIKEDDHAMDSMRYMCRTVLRFEIPGYDW